MRKSVMVMVLLAMVGAWAMPTSSELQKAQGLVNELMASDLAALRAGKKTPVEVADVSVDYAAEAETEAGKFLFYKGAFDLYVRAKEYDKAADALEALRKAIPDVDRDVLIGMLTRALKNVASENGGRLTALQRQLRVEAQAERQIKALRDQLKKTPNDAAAREKLAVALALSGDWKAALTEFAKVKGDVAKVADWELSYPNGGDAWTPATAADFWWGYAEGAKLGDAAEQAFHSHAAAWYKVVLDDDSLTGIKRKLVEKRVHLLGDAVDAVGIQRNEGVGKDGKLEEGASARMGELLTFSLNAKTKMSFVKCPAGSFMMGLPGDSNPHSFLRQHKVTFTRPFWCGRFLVTVSEWSALMGEVKLTPEMKAIGPSMRMGFQKDYRKNVMAFCEKLSNRFKRRIPSPDSVKVAPTLALRRNLHELKLAISCIFH